MDKVELITRMVVENIKGKMNVPIGVSNRHVHLSAKDLAVLFGAGCQLRSKKELMAGHFAAEECVTIVSANLRTIERVRVLGPTRPQTQVEISATDAVRLGIDAPVRESGDLLNSAPLTLVGTKGSVYLREGCIIAARHIHAPPGIGFTDGETVSVSLSGERGLRFDNVKIRTDPSFRLEMHIDTDEANACGLKRGVLNYALVQSHR